MPIVSQFITETHNDNKSAFPYKRSKAENIYDFCKQLGYLDHGLLMQIRSTPFSETSFRGTMSVSLLIAT
jgi:hypothetical protein